MDPNFPEVRSLFTLHLLSGPHKKLKTISGVFSSVGGIQHSWITRSGPWTVCLSTGKDTDLLAFLGTVHQPSSAEGPQTPNQAGGGQQSGENRQILNAPSRNCSCRWAEVDEDFLHQVVKASPGHLWHVILRVVLCRARSWAPWPLCLPSNSAYSMAL